MRLHLFIIAIIGTALLQAGSAQAQSAALAGQVSSAAEPVMEGVLVSAKKDGSTVTVTREPPPVTLISLSEIDLSEDAFSDAGAAVSPATRVAMAETLPDRFLTSIVLPVSTLSSRVNP